MLGGIRHKILRVSTCEKHFNVRNDNRSFVAGEIMPKARQQVADKQERSGGVRAVSRALAILRSFEGGKTLTLGEVASAADLDKGTARRLLLTLIEARFVTQEPQTQRYSLGSAIRALAVSAPEDLDLRGVAKPALLTLAGELHMTMFLSVYRNGQAICLERFHDQQGMEVRWWQVGGTLPLNCGGAPKLMLAYQSETEIERVLAEPLVALTPKSIVDADVLRERLARIRKQAYCFAIDDVALGLAALAVPILDRKGEFVCCISIGGLTPQMSQRGRPIQLDRLRVAAEEIRQRL
jgi:DNA-binding IclR family transcriptional regulator